MHSTSSFKINVSAEGEPHLSLQKSKHESRSFWASVCQPCIFFILSLEAPVQLERYFFWSRYSKYCWSDWCFMKSPSLDTPTITTDWCYACSIKVSHTDARHLFLASFFRSKHDVFIKEVSCFTFRYFSSLFFSFLLQSCLLWQA